MWQHFIDDIAITGNEGTSETENEIDHIQKIKKVLEILESVGLEIKKEKYLIMQKQITY